MKVNNKQKRHKRHDETMSAVVYSIVSDIYTHLHIRVYVHMYVCILVSLPLCMLNLFRLFFFVFFFWYYCFLIVYTKMFVVYLYKIACTSYNQFTLYCTCVFPPSLCSTDSPSFLFSPPYLPCGFLLFRQPGKQRNQMNNCKFCCAR